MTYRVYIVEDHPTMRETYRMFIDLQPDLEVCGMAETGETALEDVPHQAPDVILVDLALPDMNGMEVVRRLRARFVDLIILVVSGNKAKAFEDLVVKGGATAYTDKQDAPATLVPTILKTIDSARASGIVR
jgi:two-component system nitrate/nitrite response regulator NarL